MEYNKLKESVAQFWEGQLSIDEEMALKMYFINQKHVADEFKEIADYFRYTALMTEDEILGEAFDDEIMKSIEKKETHKPVRRSMFNFLRIAASVIIFGYIGFTGYDYYVNTANQEEMVITDTFDDPHEAFEEMKKALMMVSTNLNDGLEYSREIKKFAEAKDQVAR